MSRCRHSSMVSRGAPAVSAQFHNSNGMAMPMPGVRLFCAAVSRSADLFIIPWVTNSTVSRGAG